MGMRGLIERIANRMGCETERNNGAGTSKGDAKRKRQSAHPSLLFFLCNLCIIGRMEHDAAGILLSLVVLDALRPVVSERVRVDASGRVEARGRDGVRRAVEQLQTLLRVLVPVGAQTTERATARTHARTRADRGRATAVRRDACSTHNDAQTSKSGGHS